MGTDDPEAPMHGPAGISLLVVDDDAFIARLLEIECSAAGYDVRTPRPTHIRYRGYDVYGMPTPSSGGSTVGEGLNIVENWDLGDLSRVRGR